MDVTEETPEGVHWLDRLTMAKAGTRLALKTCRAPGATSALSGPRPEGRNPARHVDGFGAAQPRTWRDQHRRRGHGTGPGCAGRRERVAPTHALLLRSVQGSTAPDSVGHVWLSGQFGRRHRSSRLREHLSCLMKAPASSRDVVEVGAQAPFRETSQPIRA